MSRICCSTTCDQFSVLLRTTKSNANPTVDVRYPWEAVVTSGGGAVGDAAKDITKVDFGTFRVSCFIPPLFTPDEKDGLI